MGQIREELLFGRLFEVGLDFLFDNEQEAGDDTDCDDKHSCNVFDKLKHMCSSRRCAKRDTEYQRTIGGMGTFF